ncbi:hypothetical protein U472_11440 [Orenia metallireducens]|uniref:Transposase DDE domain-containing protein n=1 Tax=Orenia metallireducens TaxID=1413210 RepID=A0A1C0A8N2_9FIRM|nr:transposase [Orenia metallireducens]OCL26592.1 hypothetical protein U472_11440 [Orenia metallireducens]
MVNNQKIEVCYNVQTTVEEKNKLILDYKVTNDTHDYDYLSVMSKNAKEILELEDITVLADKGYYKNVELKECVDNGITPYVAKPKNKNSKVFSSEKFDYDPENDHYICPAGKILIFRHTLKKNTQYKRYNNYEACNGCKLRDNCTKAQKAGRNIDRWMHKELLDEIDKQTIKNWDTYRKRQWLAEHPFGTVKRGFDSYYLLTKGINSVSTEIGLSFCAYNLKRVINVIGIKNLVKKLKEWALPILNFCYFNIRFKSYSA